MRNWLEAQKVPAGKRGKDFWRARYADINAFERHLVRNGTVIIKLFLNVSKAEQKRRFLARLETPGKNWKFSPADLTERGFWDDYQKAFEEALSETSTKAAPWYVVPADRNWFRNLVVAEILVETLEGLKLAYPPAEPGVEGLVVT